MTLPHPHRARALTPVLEDSLDAATGQARSWERALASPHLTVSQVAAGVESRLLANVGCMAQFDAASIETVLVPALDSDDQHLVFAASLGMLEAAGDFSSGLLEQLRTPKVAPPILRALGLTGNPRIERELLSLVADSGEPTSVTMALNLLAFRRAEAGVELQALLGARAPSVVAAALRLARMTAAPQVPVRAHAETLLRSEDASVRNAAIEVGLIHGSKLAWIIAQETVDAQADDLDLALHALAASGDPADVLRLAKLASTDALRPAVLFALGFTGSPLALEVCLAAMGDKRSSRLAGEAFSAITGLRLEGEYVHSEEKRPIEPIPFEEEDLDANLVPGPELELPVPDGAKVSRWWAANKSRFSPEMRYLGGSPRSGELLLEAFRRGPTRRRPSLGFELAIRTRGEWRIETRQWARLQVTRQAATVKPVMQPFGVFLE